MKKYEEYLLYKKINDMSEHPYVLLAKSPTPVALKDIEVLKDEDVISLLFWHEIQEFDDEDQLTKFTEKLEKKYIIGTECKYNDLPENADFNSLTSGIYDVKKFKEKNPKCALTRQNIVLLLEECGGVYLDSCPTEIINPCDLDKIQEITSSAIQTSEKQRGNE